MCLGNRSHHVTACDGFADPDVGRTRFANPESAVHMTVLLTRTDCPDHTVKNQGALEHYHR